MNAIGFEAQKLQEIADEYRARGYEVVVEPGPETTPDFLTGHRLDLIAHRAGESVIVEVKRGDQAASSERYREIAETVRNHPGWKFSLVIVGPKSDEIVPLTQLLISKEEIQKRIEKSKELLQNDSSDGALLLAWTSVEALLRHITEKESVPLGRVPTSSLIKEMYSSGIISKAELDTIQQVFTVRNALVHGFVADRLDTATNRLLQIADKLLTELDIEDSSN